MFGWLKKKYRRELRVAHYQNRRACDMCLVYFQEPSSFDIDTLARLSAIQAAIEQIGPAVQSGNTSPDQGKQLLDMNRELRGIYDKTASAMVRSFDKAFEPIGGWKLYHERFEMDD